MKELLEKIQDRLRAKLGHIRKSDIFITPHVDFFPNEAKFPCIGVKDGGISRAQGMDESVEKTMDVILIPWVMIVKPEASIMGDKSTGIKGVLEIEEDINDALDNEFLDIDGMEDAFFAASTGSEMLGSESKLLQKKQITYRYVKQED